MLIASQRVPWRAAVSVQKLIKPITDSYYPNMSGINLAQKVEDFNNRFCGGILRQAIIGYVVIWLAPTFAAGMALIPSISQLKEWKRPHTIISLGMVVAFHLETLVWDRSLVYSISIYFTPVLGTALYVYKSNTHAHDVVVLLMMWNLFNLTYLVHNAWPEPNAAYYFFLGVIVGGLQKIEADAEKKRINAGINATMTAYFGDMFEAVKNSDGG